MTQIASRYAQALYELAAEENLTERILEELKALDVAFLQEPDFIRLLMTRNLSKEERLGVVDSSFGGRLQPYLLNFLKILTERGHMSQFSACCKAYKAQYDEEHGILPVKAVTAVPLTESQSARLVQKMEQMTGKQIELTNVVDPACMGGVRLDYDGKRVDDTLKFRLDSIHKMLQNTVL